MSSFTTDLDLAIAETVTVTVDADAAVAESSTTSVDADAAIADTKATTTDMGMRIVDEGAQLIALDLRVVSPWENATELAERNSRITRLLSVGDSIEGIFLGDPISRELHRTDEGIVRCVGAGCTLASARALTAINIFMRDLDRVQVLVCDEALTTKLAEVAQVNGGTLHHSIAILTRKASTLSCALNYTADIETDFHFEDSFWTMIDSLELINLNSISDEDLVGPIF